MPPPWRTLQLHQTIQEKDPTNRYLYSQAAVPLIRLIKAKREELQTSTAVMSGLLNGDMSHVEKNTEPSVVIYVPRNTEPSVKTFSKVVLGKKTN